MATTGDRGLRDFERVFRNLASAKEPRHADQRFGGGHGGGPVLARLERWYVYRVVFAVVVASAAPPRLELRKSKEPLRNLLFGLPQYTQQILRDASTPGLWITSWS